jgi:hypothetical protein
VQGGFYKRTAGVIPLPACKKEKLLNSIGFIRQQKKSAGTRRLYAIAGLYHINQKA